MSALTLLSLKLPAKISSTVASYIYTIASNFKCLVAFNKCKRAVPYAVEFSPIHSGPLDQTAAGKAEWTALGIKYFISK